MKIWILGLIGIGVIIGISLVLSIKTTPQASAQTTQANGIPDMFSKSCSDIQTAINGNMNLAANTGVFYYGYYGNEGAMATYYAVMANNFIQLYKIKNCTN